MPTDKKIGEGRAAVEVADDGLSQAIANWEAAPPAEKGATAEKVLSYIGAISGGKLINYVEPETAERIRADYLAFIS